MYIHTYNIIHTVYITLHVHIMGTILVSFFDNISLPTNCIYEY